MSLANLRVGARLGLGFGAVIAMMIIIAVLGINNLRHIQGELDKMVHDKFPKVVWANDVLGGIDDVARAMRDALLETDKGKIEKQLGNIEDARKAIKEQLDKLQEKVHSNTGKALYAAILEMRSKYIDSQNAFIKLMHEGKQDEAKTLFLNETRPLQTAYAQSVSKLIQHQTEEMTNVGEEVGKLVESIVLLIIAVSLVALAVAVAVGFLIARSITRPLQEAVGLAAAVAKGDLTQRIEVKSKDETGQLLQALKDMNESLAGIVAEVRGTTDSITVDAAREGAAGNAAY
jgi:methyl-accepting chemotaxis protein